VNGQTKGEEKGELRTSFQGKSTCSATTDSHEAKQKKDKSPTKRGGKDSRGKVCGGREANELKKRGRENVHARKSEKNINFPSRGERTRRGALVGIGVLEGDWEWGRGRTTIWQ